MLPIFPNARKAMRETFNHELFEAHWNVSPVLKEIRVSAQREGREASYEREDGKTIEVEYEAHRIEREMKFEDARGLDPDAFSETARSIGTEMGRMMLDSMLSSVSKVVEEVGNVTVGKGDGIAFEDFLDMMSKMQTDFDSLGQPDVRTLVLSPEMHKQMVPKLKQWESDPDKRAAIEAVMRRKREEYNEREACRRMVD
jgi:hypothetical protein